jgi:hypothetical protein
VTVAELIDRLRAFDPAAPVVVPGAGMLEGGLVDAARVEPVRLSPGVHFPHVAPEDAPGGAPVVACVAVR